MHIIAAKAVALGEALTPEFKAYQQRIVENAQTLSKALMEKGIKLVSGGTDNHLMLVDLIGTGITGKELERRLDEVHITLNKNASPNDPESPFVTSGVRIGTAAATTRGFDENDMDVIAECISLVIKDFDNNADKVRAMVEELGNKYPLYE